MNLHKVSKIAAIIVAVLSIIFLAGILLTEDGEPNSWINPLIYLSYVILLACVAVVLIYVFKNLFSSKENLKKTLISVGLFLGVALVSFILANGSEVRSAKNEIIATESVSKWAGTGILLCLLLAAIAVASIVWSGFNKIKK